MALPKQVQAQLDEAEALEKELTARKGKPTEAPVVKVVEPEADTSDDAPEPKASEKEKKPEEAKPADTPTTDVEQTFERKYKTLLGKYDAEVPRLHQRVKELTEKLDELSTKLVEQSKQETTTKVEEEVSYVTDADREEFGEELIDVQRRVAKEVAREYDKRLQTQEAVIEDLKKRLGETDGKIGHMTFSQKLAHLVPDFDQVDNDPRWIAWLDEHDPILRGPRRVQAVQAYNAGDAEAVAHYVGLFKQTITDAPKPESTKRQSELEKQVAPNRSANSSRTQSAGRDSKIYSAGEVKAAWDKIRVLNTRGKVDDAAKLEAELTTAYLEGRVRA